MTGPPIIPARPVDTRPVADDLRDGALQGLTALGLRLTVLRRSPALDPQTESALGDIAAELDLELDGLRRAIRAIRAAAPDLRGDRSRQADPLT